MKREKRSSAPALKQDMVQIPFRITAELKSRIHRALGKEMTRTGEKLTANEFIRTLIEKSLTHFE